MTSSTTPVEDYTRNGQRYDWILDIAGNHSLLECRRALKPRGVYVLIGGPMSRIFAALIAGPGDLARGKQEDGSPDGMEALRAAGRGDPDAISSKPAGSRPSSTDATRWRKSQPPCGTWRQGRRGGRSSSPCELSHRGRHVPQGRGDPTTSAGGMVTDVYAYRGRQTPWPGRSRSMLSRGSDPRSGPGRSCAGAPGTGAAAAGWRSPCPRM